MNNPIVTQFNELSEDYSHIKEKNILYYNTLIRTLHEYSDPQQPIIEIGCGSGGILNHISRVPGVGIDISPKMIEVAKSKFPLHRYICEDLTQLELNESFKTIFLPDVLEYIQDLDAVFKKIHSICKENGKVIITSPNPKWRYILKILERCNLKMKDKYSYPKNTDQIIASANKFGFQVLKSHTQLLIPLNNKFFTFLNKYLIKIWPFKDFGVMMVIVLELE